MEMLKYSIDPAVRKQFFLGFSNSCRKENLPVVSDLCQIRSEYATTVHQSPNFFRFQSQRNLMQIEDLKGKI